MANYRSTISTVPPLALAWRPGVVAWLLLACFVPRAIAAWNWDVLWGDSLHYHYASLALEQGDYRKGLLEFGLNIYPLMLIPLRHLGIDWQTAGKWFSVLMATLTVVPLWAWLRRMFDDRAAVLSCLVYAVHGKLIAISPLIIRDSTFWFLFAMTLYCLWCAVAEVRLSCFLAAGAALTLAIHTRTEGWLLLTPLLGWTACRYAGPASADATCRLRLILGTIACLAVVPASIILVNTTWLRENPQWELLRKAHRQILAEVLHGNNGNEAALPDPDVEALVLDVPPESADRHDLHRADRDVATAAGQARTVRLSATAYVPLSSVLPPVAVPSEKSASGLWLAFKLLERVAKGFTWIGSLLLLAGILFGWRTFLRPEHLTLLAMNLLLLALSGIRYPSAGVDLRYFMPMVIVGLPWMACARSALWRDC